MATPQVPPRPTRSRAPASPAAADAAHVAPKVPPRPAGRRKDQSVSPDRYAPSPLNDLPRKTSSSALYSNAKNNRSNSSIDAPPRPPSVNLPTLGQEGSEYADLEVHEHEQNALEKTKSEGAAAMSHVGSDLPLHAPKPALSKSTAKAQVAAVTRTDSSQAAAALGIASPPRDDPDPYGRPLKSKSSSGAIRSGSSMSTERPPSASQLDEHGIPQIGRHVPLLFNAGDVQAPTPTPGSQPDSMSNSVEDLRQQRHHRRKHSGREVFHGPPGSYGLHGHGAAHNDQFEKSWYAKHPEEQAKEEQGHYGSALSGNRPEFALSSDDLNKIVRDSARGAGLGTARNVVGLPDEQVGYMASDEYASRLKSPRAHTGSKHRSSNSQTHVESPLRRTSFPQDSLDAQVLPIKKDGPSDAGQGEEEGVIHIDPPEDPVNRITGEGVETHENLGLRRTSSDADGGYAEDHGYHAPILASDEVTPGSEWQQPAMSPSFPPDRRGSAHFDDYGGLHRHLSHLGGSGSSSRAGSRPGSIQGVPAMTKIYSHDDHEDRHTPLENVEEYEPLFPDDDGKLKKASTPAERFKQRPDLKQRFPSQDIWEDTPDSLRLETEVTSPEPAEQRLQPEPAIPETLIPESVIQASQIEPTRQDVQPTPSEELRAKKEYKPGVSDRVSALASQRFPSRDIWEDSPDSAALTTIVMDPEEQNESVVETEPAEANEAIAKAHPSVPPRPERTRGSGASQEAGAHPHVPPRPPKKKLSTESAESIGEAKSITSDARKPPSIPERPKPSIPSRPSKSVSRDSEEAPLAKTVSAGSTGSVGEEVAKAQKPPPPVVKAKPNIPTRPAGSKIAALQAGFMADLNSRLKIGPSAQHPPKKEEVQEEKQPLQDARKSRARGPARRKPGAMAASQQKEAESSIAELSFSAVWTVWHSEPDGSIVVSPPVAAPTPKAQHSPEEELKQGTPHSEPVTEKTPAGAEFDLPHKETTALSKEAIPSHDKEPETHVPPKEDATGIETGHTSAPPEAKTEAPSTGATEVLGESTGIPKTDLEPAATKPGEIESVEKPQDESSAPDSAGLTATTLTSAPKTTLIAEAAPKAEHELHSEDTGAVTPTKPTTDG